MKQILSSSLTLVEGKTEYSFFKNEESEPNIRISDEFKEKEILEFLFKDQTLKSQLLKEFYNDLISVDVHFEVTDPFISKGDGDIDLLFIDRVDPKTTVAVQAKKIKIEIDKSGKPKINNLSNVFSVLKQSKKYKNLGFSRNYIFLIILDDAINDETISQFYKTATNKTDELNFIFNLPSNENYDRDYGLFLIKVSQLFQQSIKQTVRVSFHMIKDSTRLPQSSYLNEKIISFLKK